MIVARGLACSLQAPFRRLLSPVQHTRVLHRQGFARAASATSADAPSSSSDKQPVIALVGRPNVGKSTMFNRLVGRRLALVHDTPNSHVTRDYREGHAKLSDLRFFVLDTPGLDAHHQPDSIQERSAAVIKQVQLSAAMHDPCQ